MADSHRHGAVLAGRAARAAVPLVAAVVVLASLAPVVVPASTGTAASAGASASTGEVPASTVGEWASTGAGAGPTASPTSAASPAANASTTDPGADRAPVAAAAATTVSACGTIDAPGVYVLSNDLSTADGSCIVVTASDVVLDGRGHTITETGGGNDTGVSVGGGVLTTPSNVTVRNLTVEGWAVGVGGRFAADLRVENVVVSGGGTGVSLSLVSNATVRDVESGFVAPARAVRASATSNVTVRDLEHRGTLDGGGTDAPPAVDVEGGNVSLAGASLTCAGTCVRVANASGVTVSGLNVTGAGDDGVRVEASTGVRVVDSTVTNAGDGVRLDTVEDARVASVDVASPRGTGVAVLNGATVTLADVRVTDARFDAVAVAGDTVDVRVTDVVAVSPGGNGLDLFLATDARVEGVDVVDAGKNGVAVSDSEAGLADVRVDGYRFSGISLTDSLADRGDTAVVVDGFTVRNPTDPELGDAVVATASDVTLRNGRTVGGTDGVVGTEENLTVANVTAAGAGTGVRLFVEEPTALRNVTVRNATGDAVRLLEAEAGEGRFENLTVSNPGGAAVNVTAGPTRLDNLTTDGGRVSAVVRRAALLEPSGTPATGERVRVAAVGFEPVGSGTASAELAVPYDPTRVNESTVALYRAGAFRWEPVPEAVVERGVDLVTANLTTAGTYGVQGRATATAPPPGPSCPTVSGTPATNVDADPACEDVDGDGDVDLSDVFALAFEVVPDPPADPTPFDFDGDGDVDLDDAFALAFSP
jgi:hypothetical protein